VVPICIFLLPFDWRRFPSLSQITNGEYGLWFHGKRKNLLVNKKVLQWVELDGSSYVEAGQQNLPVNGK